MSSSELIKKRLVTMKTAPNISYNCSTEVQRTNYDKVSVPDYIKLVSNLLYFFYLQDQNNTACYL